MAIKFTPDSNISFMPDSSETFRSRISIKNPAVSALKGISEATGALFPTQYYISRIPKLLGGRGLEHAEAMRSAEEIVKPIEEAKVEGLPSQISYGAAQAAPILVGTANPFMAGAKGILGAASKIPAIGKIAAMPIARTTLGFGGYEAARGAIAGRDIPESFKQGAAGGGGYHLGLRGGATLGKFLPTKIKERIGSAAGAAAIGAISAPEGERIPS